MRQAQSEAVYEADRLLTAYLSEAPQLEEPELRELADHVRLGREALQVDSSVVDDPVEKEWADLLVDAGRQAQYTLALCAKPVVARACARLLIETEDIRKPFRDDITLPALMRLSAYRLPEVLPTIELNPHQDVLETITTATIDNVRDAIVDPALAEMERPRENTSVETPRKPLTADEEIQVEFTRSARILEQLRSVVRQLELHPKTVHLHKKDIKGIDRTAHEISADLITCIDEAGWAKWKLDFASGSLPSDQIAVYKHLVKLGIRAEEFLINGFQAFNQRVATKFVRQDGLGYEDLMAAGNIGLLDAISRYDADSEDANFVSLATTRIKGAMVDYIREHGNTIKMPRQTMTYASSVRRFEEAGMDEDEIDEAIGWDASTKSKTARILELNSIARLDQSLEADGETTLGDTIEARLADESHDEADADLWDLRERAMKTIPRWIKEAGLNDRHRLLFAAYFGMEWLLDKEDVRWFNSNGPFVPLHAIGERLGVTESRASQLLRDVALFMKQQIAYERIVSSTGITRTESQAFHDYLFGKGRMHIATRPKAVLEILHGQFGHRVTDAIGVVCLGQDESSATFIRQFLVDYFDPNGHEKQRISHHGKVGLLKKTAVVNVLSILAGVEGLEIQPSRQGNHTPKTVTRDR